MFDYLTTDDFIEISGQRLPVSNLRLHATCYSHKRDTIFGTARAKIVTFDMDTSVVAEGTTFVLHCGTADEDGDGQDNIIGTFIVKDAPTQDTNGLIQVTALDIMHKANINYTSALDYASGAVTLMDVLNEVCALTGIALRDGQTLANADFIVDSNQFASWQTCRNVIAAIAGATGSFAAIINDELAFIAPDIGANAVAEVSTDQYTTLNLQQATPPVNTVTIKNTLTEESSSQSSDGNPISEIVLYDIPFAYNEEKREALIPAILDKLSGFTYVPFTAAGLGDPSLNIGDPLIIDDKDGNTYSTFAISMIYISTQDDKKNSSLSAPAKSQSAVNYAAPIPKAEQLAKQAYELSQTFKEAIDAATAAISNPGLSYVKWKKTINGVLTDCSPLENPEEEWWTSKEEVDSTTNILRINSAGFGLSKDGGAHYTQAITGFGILASALIFDSATGNKMIIGNPTGQRVELYSTAGAPFIDFYDPNNVLRSRWNYDGLKFTDATGTIITTLATTTADATLTVGAGKMFSSIQAAYDSIPLFDNHNISIVPDGGTYNEDVVIKNHLGTGKISLNPTDTIYVNSITVLNCINEIAIYGNRTGGNSIYLTTTTNDACSFINSSLIRMHQVISTSSALGNRGIYAQNVHHFDLAFVIMSNKGVGLNLFDSTQCTASGVSGTGNTIGISMYQGTKLTDLGANTITGTTPRNILGGEIIPVSGFQGLPSDVNLGNVLNLKQVPSAGMMVNGKIVTSVSGNNLTAAVKTLASYDPSATDPVYVMIGDTIRSITSALSVTLNAGTNYFNAGSNELKTQEIDYFVYLGYNATDGVTLGFARIPYATFYGDFSTTNTNEKYCAISTITHAAAIDRYEVVGRFNAILGASSTYYWSIPATSIVINKPIFETRWLTWAPTFTCTGSLTWATTSDSGNHANYKVSNNEVKYDAKYLGNTGGTASNEVMISTPFTHPRFTVIPGLSKNTSGAVDSCAPYTSADAKIHFAAYDGSNWANYSGRFLAAGGAIPLI